MWGIVHVPIDITIKLMSWTARLRLRDARGEVIWHAGFDKSIDGELPIFADERMDRRILAIKWTNAFAQ